MADLTITASQVLPDTTGDIFRGTSGATVTAGQTVYLDTSTNLIKLADANASALTAVTMGIALHAALTGQPLAVQRRGTPTLGAGAAPAVGTIYIQSATAGGIAPAADLATGYYATIVGVGTTGNKLTMPSGGPFVSGQVVP
jgi:hypothetical protein